MVCEFWHPGKDAVLHGFRAYLEYIGMKYDTPGTTNTIRVRGKGRAECPFYARDFSPSRVHESADKMVL